MEKILVVEDHPIIMRAMLIMLTHLNCIIDQAFNGSEALEYFNNNDYSLILIDIGLPDIDGLKVIELMRKTSNKSKAATPIIVTSAHSDEEYRNQATALGVEDFLVKPLTLESCEAFVKKYSK